MYELVPGKSGLKIIAVEPPPEPKPGEEQVVRPGSSLPPGTLMNQTGSNGVRVLNGHAIWITQLIRAILDELGDRPVVNHSGVTVYFDLKDFTWAAAADAGSSGAPEAAALFSALEEQLGLKLVPAKDPVEVLVIDSIEKPSAN